MSESQQPAGGSFPPIIPSGTFANFGYYLRRGFEVYLQRWRDWLAPMAISAAVAVAAFLCCVVPCFLVAGPLVCGLYSCAICTVRGRHMDYNTLRQASLENVGRALVGWLVIQMLVAGPIIVLYVTVEIGRMLLDLLLGGLHHPTPNPMAAIVILPLSLVMYGGLVLATLGLAAWTCWISTRTMFIMPLIADRGLDLSTAWHRSWETTRDGFWELLLLNVIAGMIGSIGVYACYVGLIFTLPIYYTIIAAAYEHRVEMSPTVR